MTILEFLIYDYQLVSSDKMYRPTKASNGKGAFFRRSKELLEWQKFYINSFNNNLFFDLEKVSTLVNSLDKMQGFILSIIVSIPKNNYYFLNGKLKRLDISNMIKALEDSVMSTLGINDTYNIKVLSEKGYNTSDRWVTKVILETCDSDNLIEIDNLKSRRIFYNE